MSNDIRLVILSTILAFFIVLLLGPIIIPALKKYKFGQSIRQEGPKSHLKKAGTPTMGGVMFIIAIIISSLVVAQKLTGHLGMALLSTVGFGVIGFLDDSIKIKKKRNLGLKAYQKIIGQLVISIILAIYAYTSPDIGSTVYIPFTNKLIDFGIWYVPFMVFVLIAVTNAVNLTDGLDGLLSTITAIVSLFFTIVLCMLGNRQLAIFCGAICGGLLGFLRYNSYPAQVFMGDTGSLALGGAVAAVIMLMKSPFIVVIVGLIYVVEAFSVVIQVGYFKLTGGKRFFKMAPIHHHFEQKGWHETKVVALFSIMTAICCLIGFLAISL